MTIKECIDFVDDLKPNQYSTKVKVMWLSFIDETIINDVLKTHEGYDGRYDNFTGYSEDKLSVPLIVMSPYDRLYTAYLKMKIDAENGETARYNNSVALFNSYMMEYRKFYNKTHLPLSNVGARISKPMQNQSQGISDAMYENIKRELYARLSEDFSGMVSDDKLYDIVTSYALNNIEMLKGKDGANGQDGVDGINGRDGVNGRDGYTPIKGIDYFDGKDAIIDQTYNPESENAQSGKALSPIFNTKATVFKGTEINGSSPNGIFGISAKELQTAKIGDVYVNINTTDVYTCIKEYDGYYTEWVALNKCTSDEYDSQSPMAMSGIAVGEAINNAIGDIDAALDAIIALQNSIIGG